MFQVSRVASVCTLKNKHFKPVFVCSYALIILINDQNLIEKRLFDKSKIVRLQALKTIIMLIIHNPYDWMRVDSKKFRYTSNLSLTHSQKQIEQMETVLTTYEHNIQTLKETFRDKWPHLLNILIASYKPHSLWDKVNNVEGIQIIGTVQWLIFTRKGKKLIERDDFQELKTINIEQYQNFINTMKKKESSNLLNRYRIVLYSNETETKNPLLSYTIRHSVPSSF